MNQFNEPWRWANERVFDNNYSTGILDASSNLIFVFSIGCYKGHRDRIVQCVNSCAGINDPAAAIQAAREALQAAARSLPDPSSLPVTPTEIGAIVRTVRAAQILLGPPTERTDDESLR